jgi:hypothetical protein
MQLLTFVEVNIIQLLHLNDINMRFYMLHKTSYWSSSTVVIVLLHTALYTLILKFYENFEIFETFWKFYHFEFFWNLMKFFSFEILWIFWIFTPKNWNFNKFWKFSKKKFKNRTLNLFILYFIILWNFLTYWLAKSNFCAIKNLIIQL